MFSPRLLAILAVSACFAVGYAQAQTSTRLQDIDQQRTEQLGQLREAGMPSAVRIREAAARIFAQPVDEQTVEALLTLAREANAYANLVGRLYAPYEREWQENARFDFVRNALRPVLGMYERLDNEFKTIRNRAYMNLGEKAEARGEILEAFFFYNDTYRLEMFACQNARDTALECPRVGAEERMRRLLGIDATPPPYTRWSR